MTARLVEGGADAKGGGDGGDGGEHEPGTEAASAGKDSGLDADGGISTSSGEQEGRACLSFLGPFDHVDYSATGGIDRGGRELWAGSLD